MKKLTPRRFISLKQKFVLLNTFMSQKLPWFCFCFSINSALWKTIITNFLIRNADIENYFCAMRSPLFLEMLYKMKAIFFSPTWNSPSHLLLFYKKDSKKIIVLSSQFKSTQIKSILFESLPIFAMNNTASVPHHHPCSVPVVGYYSNFCKFCGVDISRFR
jgi:hypothetical protein